MKKFIVVCFIITILIITPVVALAEGYLAIGGGSGSNGSNLTLEAGSVSIDKEYNHLMALGIGFIFNAGDVPSDTLDYPCPHGDYTNLGTEQKGTEIVILGKYGLEVIKNEGLFLVGLAGFSFSENVDLAQSNVTGWYYEQSSSSSAYGILGGGLSYFPPNTNISFQIEYDNRRGVTGGIGTCW